MNYQLDSSRWLLVKFILSLHELDPYDERVEGIYQWHPFTGLTFKPNCIFLGTHPNQKGKAFIQIDEKGFLSNGEKLKYQKSKDEIRIATIGGSTTASINLTFEENWPGYLGMLVQKALPGKKIQVINAGVPGFDTAQSIGNLSLRVMPFTPDIVIIYHAYNDLKAIRPDRDFKPDYSHIHQAPYGFLKKPNYIIRFLNYSMFYVRLRNMIREYNQDIKKNSEVRKNLY